MEKLNVHTVPNGGKWSVMRDGSKRYLSTHKKKSTAMKKAISLAKKYKVEHVIHDKHGRVVDKDSYGNDPCPPKDKVF